MSWTRPPVAAAVLSIALSSLSLGAAPATPAAARAVRDTVVVNQFMSYDASATRVRLSLTASLGSHNGGMNFNGGFKGDQTITIPAGWRVHIAFQNKDAIPHSAIVLPDSFPLPMSPESPAIAQAYTRDVTAGIPTDGTDTMDFTAKPAGNYLIVCGVPGHGPSGMYIKLVVSATAKVPSYTMP